MGSTYQQAVLTITNPQTFALVREAIGTSFSPARAPEFMKAVERASLRIRDFEAILGKGLLGVGVSSQYAALEHGDQGQIREFYLASLEQVAPELRHRFFKLYAYY